MLEESKALRAGDLETIESKGLALKPSIESNGFLFSVGSTEGKGWEMKLQETLNLGADPLKLYHTLKVNHTQYASFTIR